jgi:hypothetical protein
MKNYYWNAEELFILEEWDWVSKYIDAQFPSPIPVDDTIKYLLLEARLIISNKLVIVYSGNTLSPTTIMSFKELAALSEKTIVTEEKVLFHPINFKSLLEYRSFLTGVREKLFSLSN